MIKKIVNLILIILITFSFFKNIFLNKNNFLSKFDLAKISNLYNQSQFSVNPELRRFIIQDDDLYAYSGWYYLKTGEIDTINIEHPPLGKYLIGLSILLFGNQNVGQILWSCLFLICFFCLSRLILKNYFLSLLCVFSFMQEKIFVEQLSHSLLDIILGTFLLILLLITLSHKKLTKNFILAQGFLFGTIASIKYPSLALLLFLTITIYYAVRIEKRLLTKLYATALVAFIVYLLSYLPFFIHHPNPSAFGNLQVKALKIHLSHVPEYPKAQVFRVLFLNQWQSWWDTKSLVKTEFWSLLWPILTINFLLSFKVFKKNLLINLWCLFYLLFLASRLFFPRYLFLLLPFLYLNLCYNFKYLYYLMINRHK